VERVNAFYNEFREGARILTKEPILSLTTQLLATLDPDQAQVIASRLKAEMRKHIDDLRIAGVLGSSANSES
jgi:hypothetical protein